MNPIYLDNAATTKPDAVKLQEAAQLLTDNFFNPSSTHKGGLVARDLIERSRKTIAKSLGCKSGELFFTSSGTESNNMALNGAAELGEIVVCSTTEHPSMVDCSVSKIGVNKDGSYDLNQIEDRMKSLQRWKARKTLAVSLVNAETGLICVQDNSLWDLCQRYGWSLHIDAVAAYMKMPLGFKADTMSISAHKVHGLKGVGALYVREGMKLYRSQVGGGQERGLRPGTENILGIVHFGMTVGDGAPQEDPGSQKKFEELLSDVSVVNCGSDKRTWNISNLYFPKIKDLDLFLHELDEAGVMASGKSACSSGMPEPSKVLESMYGKDAPETQGSVRFSFSKDTTVEEVERAAEIVKKVLEQV